LEQLALFYVRNRLVS